MKILKNIITPVFLFMFTCVLLVGCNPTRVDKVELTNPICVNYALNDEIELKDAKLKVFYSNNTDEELEITSDMITGFDTITLGNKKMTISYEGKSVDISYVVSEVRFGMYKYSTGGIYIGLQLSQDGTGVYYSAYQGVDNESLIFNWIKSGDIIYLSTGGSVFTTLNVVNSTQLNLSADFTSYPLIYVF